MDVDSTLKPPTHEMHGNSFASHIIISTSNKPFRLPAAQKSDFHIELDI